MIGRIAQIVVAGAILAAVVTLLIAIVYVPILLLWLLS